MVYTMAATISLKPMHKDPLMLRFLPPLALILAAGCASSPSHEHPHAHSAHTEGAHTPGHHHRFTDPQKYVAQWNTPARDAWQKPQEIVAALGLGPGQTVADVGAGTGYLLPHLSQAVGPQGKVWAVDVEEAMVSYLKQAAQKEQWGNVQVKLAAANSAGLEAASLDAAVILNTWHHIEDRAGYLDTLAPMMRPGARLLVVDFEPGAPGEGPPPKMRLSAQTVIEEITQAGWRAELVEDTMPRHYVVRAWAPAL